MKKKIDIIYVILHYQTIESTVECVESILENAEKEKIVILIVDNGSSNGTGSVLTEKFFSNSNIEVIINDFNFGFAKGNNIGIEYAKQKYDFDFIVLLNNDVRLVGNNWYDVIENKYLEYRFDVLGPNIIDPQGHHTANPDPRQVENYEELLALIKLKKREIVLNKLYIRPVLNQIHLLIKKILKYPQHYPEFVSEDKENVQIEGSCLILSKKYFRYMSGLYPHTFLYFEEAIMRYIADKKNMLIVYTPQLTLVHDHSLATRTEIKRERTRTLFYLKHSLDSCFLLKKMMEEDAINGDYL